MDRETIIFAVAFFVGLGAISSFAATTVGGGDMEGAVAEAIKTDLADWFQLGSRENHGHPFPKVSLCLESEQSLNFDKLARSLSRTPLEPIPLSRCTSRTSKGDFVMFNTRTSYYDEQGENAFHLKIPKIECATESSCVVDIDDVGSGSSYSVKRQGDHWIATDRKLRWIV